VTRFQHMWYNVSRGFSFFKYKKVISIQQDLAIS